MKTQSQLFLVIPGALKDKQKGKGQKEGSHTESWKPLVNNTLLNVRTLAAIKPAFVLNL